MAYIDNFHILFLSEIRKIFQVNISEHFSVFILNKGKAKVKIIITIFSFSFLSIIVEKFMTAKYKFDQTDGSNTIDAPNENNLEANLWS